MATKYYTVVAPRNVRALYYAGEYGVRGANRILAIEAKELAPVRVCAGTAKKINGLFKRKRDAVRYQARVLSMAAARAGRLGGDLANGDWMRVVVAGVGEIAALLASNSIQPFGA